MLMKLKHLFLRDTEQLERVDMLAKVLAVGIYADKYIHEREVIEAKAIIDECGLDDGYKKYASRQTERLVKKYKINQKIFKKDKQEIIEAIINKIDENLEMVIIRIFKSDGVIAAKEQEIIENLEEFFEYRRITAKHIREKMKKIS